MLKAVVFDFNGTLFFDTEKHEEAWQKYAEGIIGRPLTADDNAAIMGRSNEMILKYLLGRMPKAEETRTMGNAKEALYRELCLKDPKCMTLAHGAADFLDALAARNIPTAIATSSPIDNIEFYFDKLGIGRWFDMSDVVYDDGTVRGKPEPDIYLAAAAKLHLDPSEILVFEDSLSGIASARSAGVKSIAAVTSSNSAETLAAQDGVSLVFDDYANLPDIDILLHG